MGQSNEMIIIIRPSFKKFCGDDACQAALFNHLLFWIAKKAKGQPEDKVKNGDVYWWSTTEGICDGIDRSWSVNKVRQEIKNLVDARLVGQRRNPDKGWDQTRHYFFGDDQGKILLDQCKKYDICLQHLGLHADVIHLLNLVNAIAKSGKCNCQIDEMDLPNLVDPITRFGNAIPKDSTKVSTKDSSKEISHTDQSQSSSPSSRTRKTRALSPQSSKEKDDLNEKPLPPEMPPTDMSWGTRKCLLKFDAWRGSILIGKYKLSQASSCAKGLAEQYTEEEVEMVYKSMNGDSYWISRGGADIGDVSNNIHKEIKKIKYPKKLVLVGGERKYPALPGQARSSCDDPNYEDDSFYPTREVN